MNNITLVVYHFDGQEHELIDLYSKEGFCSISVKHWSGKPMKMYVPLRHITFV